MSHEWQRLELRRAVSDAQVTLFPFSGAPRHCCRCQGSHPHHSGEGWRVGTWFSNLGLLTVPEHSSGQKDWYKQCPPDFEGENWGIPFICHKTLPSWSSHITACSSHSFPPSPALPRGLSEKTVFSSALVTSFSWSFVHPSILRRVLYLDQDSHL